MKHMTPDKNTQLKELSDAGVVVYAKTIEDEAIFQIKAMADSPLGTNAHIRIMPDCHAGKGCTIGTTMRITDKVCPNLVGVDIGCGVTLIKTNINFKERLQELDNVIRKYVPHGQSVQSHEMDFPFQQLHCWDFLPENIQARAKRSLGTLGGGNHFIEAYDGGYIAVHSGSRNIGLAVAQYYQDLAERRIAEHNSTYIREHIQSIPPHEREAWIKDNRINIPKELSYLTGQDMEDYLHDVAIMLLFAFQNRRKILLQIITPMKGESLEYIESIHNYIDTYSLILRKGAIAAHKG